LAIEGVEPDASDLVELAHAGKYRTLRQVITESARDLKNRFFNKMKKGFTSVTVDDALTKGQLHDVNTLFNSLTTPALTNIHEYGYNNRRSESQFNEPYLIPAINQHMAVNSEMTHSRNTITGVVTEKPYIGGPIFDGFIAVLTVNGKLPHLNFLSVAMAYNEAKEHDIHLGKGFNWRLAAREFKDWVLDRDVRKKGPILQILKDYRQEVMAARNARQGEAAAGPSH